MDTDLAYAAGLIDGEGCVHLCVTKGTYRARVTVGMTEPALTTLRWMHETWGGSLIQGRARTAAWEAAWVWTLTGSGAGRFLEQIRPFLRIKAPQADVALQLERIRAGLPRTHGGRGSWTDEARVKCEALKGQLHLLNQKGPRATATSVEG